MMPKSTIETVAAITRSRMMLASDNGFDAHPFICLRQFLSRPYRPQRQTAKTRVRAIWLRHVPPGFDVRTYHSEVRAVTQVVGGPIVIGDALDDARCHSRDQGLP